MIAKEDMLKKYNISEEFFEDAEISWEELEGIYNDYSQKKENGIYDDILRKFVDNYLGDLKTAGIHSYRTRIKDPEHLIEKIIRKRKEKFTKYKNIGKDNYEKYLTDIIGIRCFILFKEDWKLFHNFIMGQFYNNSDLYIKDPEKDFICDSSRNYIAEAPKVHIRNGDNDKIYEGIIAPGRIIKDRVYRSVHYIIKYEGAYIEIQVRTLFEEGWSEVDHAKVYPYYTEDPVFNQYTNLLNRLTGLADEMGSFFLEVERLEEMYLACNKPDASSPPDKPPKNNCDQDSGKVLISECENTPMGCLSEVIQE